WVVAACIAAASVRRAPAQGQVARGGARGQVAPSASVEAAATDVRRRSAVAAAAAVRARGRVVVAARRVVAAVPVVAVAVEARTPPRPIKWGVKAVVEGPIVVAPPPARAEGEVQAGGVDP